MHVDININCHSHSVTMRRFQFKI
ncbi:hypothetical protein OIU76_018880 [Salix suchowensis]|uniref:Uncharacterized protein n=1 Tax=Salix suchowensis TaxID=1278906 RepID=A0ABQ8ZI07_9ROSI|nr:hypothetical protein OIU76_018880 [Salix suchowensis]KAJ6301418.1 hypothetical protein OIU77_015674 [Salix suchowensis]